MSPDKNLYRLAEHRRKTFFPLAICIFYGIHHSIPLVLGLPLRYRWKVRFPGKKITFRKEIVLAFIKMEMYI